MKTKLSGMYNSTNTSQVKENEFPELSCKIPYEKVIKMTLETARELYKSFGDVDGNTVRKFLFDNFTKEELEGKKGYTWEKSFTPDGFYIGIGSDVIPSRGDLLNPVPSNRNVFRKQKQALSALAFAQLSHIVAKMNEGKEFDNELLWSVEVDRKDRHNVNLVVCDFATHGKHIAFCAEEDARISLEMNRALWEQFWML